MFKLIPSYVGSKSSWVKYLEEFRGERFVELFAGSAVISFNLASQATLVDLDPYVIRIISEFDKQIVPEVFTKEDYFRVRSQPNWWMYAYCLQKMSFSGVFRYSKNGYNVPVKKNLEEIKVRDDYIEALFRWRDLKPKTYFGEYDSLYNFDYSKSVVVLDPPYYGSQASYNKSKFDYVKYYEFVNNIKYKCKSLILFDRNSNLENNNIPPYIIKSMRVNGKYKGDVQAMAIFKNGEWYGEL